MRFLYCSLFVWCLDLQKEEGTKLEFTGNEHNHNINYNLKYIYIMYSFPSLTDISKLYVYRRAC